MDTEIQTLNFNRDKTLNRLLVRPSGGYHRYHGDLFPLQLRLAHSSLNHRQWCQKSVPLTGRLNPPWVFPQEALNPQQTFSSLQHVAFLAGNTFVSGGVVQLSVTSVSLNISYSPATAITCSCWAPFLPYHPLSFVPLKQHLCTQAKKAAMALQFC